MVLPPRPLFLCLEGLDGTGKSTQCELLVSWLERLGRKVVFARDPGSTGLGLEIRRLLLEYKGNMATGCEMALFFAARAQMLEEVIRPALKEGRDVVLDRYLLSTIAYQGYGAGLDVDRIWQAGLFAARDLLPQLILVLDLAVNVSMGRLNGIRDRMESRGNAYFDSVRNGFLQEASKNPETIRIISAEGDRLTVHSRIRQEICNAFNE